MKADPKKNILIVDDELNVLSSIKRLLRDDGITCFTASSGQEGLEIFKRYDIGVVLSDQQMPHMSGVTFLEKIKEFREDTVRVLLTGYSSKDSAIEAINKSGIFLYLTKPWNNDELRAAIDRAFDHYWLKIENRRLLELTQSQNRELLSLNIHLEDKVVRRTRDLHLAVRNGIIMLASAAEAKDDVTGGHVQRIAATAEQVCIALGLGGQVAGDIGFFSMMHDVGKIHIPDCILQKKGKLTPEEWRIMKTHTIAGEKIMGESKYYSLAREIARSHHERWDGGGYPDGLAGEAIPMAARIVSVVDVFDALMNNRPYKKAWPKEKAVAELVILSGKAFDSKVVDAFVSVLEKSSAHEGKGKVYDGDSAASNSSG